jgi:hypothetical protein
MPTVLVQISKFETDGEAGSPELPPDSFELSFEHNTTVRELIRRTVEENAKAQMRQSRRHLHEEMGAISQGALTDQQIQERAAKGKVGVPTAVSFRRKLRRSHIDVSAQVRRAWEAFEKRDFLLTVDGRMASELDEPIVLGIHAKVVFLRTAAFLWLPFRSKD